jgi:hypothetical protein
MIPVDDTLNSLAKTILALPDLRVAPQRTALFQYLWTHRDEYSRPIDIWEEALHELSKSKKKDDQDYDFEEAVRQQCLDLRRFLRKYFARATRGWCVLLPNAVERRGYQLQCIKLDDPESITLAFWKAHLTPPPNVAVVYPEQLFYQDWPEHFTFRYFHLNAEQESRALEELKAQYPEMYKDSLIAAYPYVAAGDVEARDLIVRWFAEHTLVKVQQAITRRMDDRAIAESSLILFRSAASNRMIADILRSSEAKHLAFRLQAGGVSVNGRRYGRVMVKEHKDEKIRADELERFAPYNPVRIGSEWQLDFSPEKGVELAILSRVRNPHAETAVTILNTDSGRAVEQIARLLTDEERMRAGVKDLKFPVPYPESFEILYAIPVGSITTDYRRAKLETLAWRTYGN